MSQTQNSQRNKIALAGAVAAAIAVGGGLAWWGARVPSTLPPTEQRIDEQQIEQPGATAPPQASEPGSQSGVATDLAPPAEGENATDSRTGDGSGTSVYWVASNGSSIEYDVQQIATNPGASDSDKLRIAMTELLEGGEATAIPPQTELLSAEVKGKDVYVDLSSEFMEGGGSAAMAARLGQVIYTASANKPDAQVWISVEGEPLKELGGEGLIVSQPLTVATFERDFGF